MGEGDSLRISICLCVIRSLLLIEVIICGKDLREAVKVDCRGFAETMRRVLEGPFPGLESFTVCLALLSLAEGRMARAEGRLCVLRLWFNG